MLPQHVSPPTGGGLGDRRTEVRNERMHLLGCEGLIAEEDHTVVEQHLPDRPNRVRRKRSAEIDAADRRSHHRGQRLYFEFRRCCHLLHPPECASRPDQYHCYCLSWRFRPGA